MKKISILLISMLNIPSNAQTDIDVEQLLINSKISGFCKYFDNLETFEKSVDSDFINGITNKLKKYENERLGAKNFVNEKCKNSKEYIKYYNLNISNKNENDSSKYLLNSAFSSGYCGLIYPSFEMVDFEGEKVLERFINSESLKYNYKNSLEFLNVCKKSIKFYDFIMLK